MEVIMRNAEGSWALREMCRDIRPILRKFRDDEHNFYEVGSYAGESSEIFRQELPFLTLVCIDPWKGGYDENDTASGADYKKVREDFLQRMSDYRDWYDFVGTSEEYFAEYKVEKEDKLCVAVYVDGLHTYEGVKSDLLNWIPKIEQGGIISGHDYHEQGSEIFKQHPHIQGVSMAVDEILGKPDKVYSDGSWYKAL